MEILVIGGSRFVGKHLVLEALRRGHDVTLFNRGNAPVPAPGVRHIAGDRNHDLERLGEGRWDAVIDTCAYVPRHVESAARAVRGRVDRYVLISTISVYARADVPHQSEGAPLAELADATTEEVDGSTYGGLKVLCERALEREFDGVRLVVRPGLVAGPDDPTDRFTYWPVRVAAGGSVLAPHGPDLPVQYIDVRDLATFTLDRLDADDAATYHVVTPPDGSTLGGLLESARSVSGAGASFEWLDDATLLEAGVKPFTELPLWIPGDDIGLMRLSDAAARRAGLVTRPLEDTVRDVLAWRGAVDVASLQAGMRPDRERALLRQAGVV